ncbi:unnamed protein product [Auanema sp. JU1783]|nr:unnamed protein product [Auanema sp. JU1783]
MSGIRLFNSIRLLNTVRASTVLLPYNATHIHTSSVCSKVKKNDKNKKGTQAVKTASIANSDNVYLIDALGEMNDIVDILGEELAKHFSIQVDLRLFEDIMVKLEKGDEHKMSHLGRVTLKSPQMVMINFANNPNAIKWAKLALQKSTLNVNPQHEGVVLYIPTPRMTRERREQLAHEAKTKIFNEFKQALNAVFTKYDKKCSQQTSQADTIKLTRQQLLTLKRGMEDKGSQIIEAKRQDLLKEVA